MTITRPNWIDAPRWANWLSQDRDGQWYWFDNMPIPDKQEGFFYPPGNQEECVKLALRGAENNHWMHTLERRPASESDG